MWTRGTQRPLRWGSWPVGGYSQLHGDGETSRDFCYVDNVVQANLRAALASSEATGGVYNIAYGEPASLADLAELMTEIVPAFAWKRTDDTGATLTGEPQADIKIAPWYSANRV